MEFNVNFVAKMFYQNISGGVKIPYIIETPNLSIANFNNTFE